MLIIVDSLTCFMTFFLSFLPRTPVSTDNTTKHTDYGPHYI